MCWERWEKGQAASTGHSIAQQHYIFKGLGLEKKGHSPSDQISTEPCTVTLELGTALCRKQPQKKAQGRVPNSHGLAGGLQHLSPSLERPGAGFHCVCRTDHWFVSPLPKHYCRRRPLLRAPRNLTELKVHVQGFLFACFPLVG